MMFVVPVNSATAEQLHMILIALTFPAVTVLNVSMSLTLVSRSGVFST